MTMIMTIWWPRSGVWIYQVVTGVTSVVGVPLTHLVKTNYVWNCFCSNFDSKNPNMWLFCMCHNSSAVVACAEFWSDLGITAHVTAALILDYELIYNCLWNWPQIWYSHNMPFSPWVKLHQILWSFWSLYPFASTKLKGGYTGFTLSVRLSVCPSVHPSVRLWTESCPPCIFDNTRRIHFIFAHLIKQKVCRV